MTNATAVLSGDNGGGAAAAAPAAAAPATAAPAAPGAVAQATPGAQTAPKVWSAEFDEQTAAYVQNKGWQSPADLLNSYRNLEKFAGGSKNLLELPGADAEPTAWDSVYAKLGRPESPDQYNLPPVEGADPELTNWFKSTAHKYGLSDKQAQAMYKEWNDMAGTKVQAMQQMQAEQSEKQISDLRREWGQAFDQQIGMGRKAVAALGLNQEKLSEYEAKLGTGEMLKLFATLGSKMGEASFEDGQRSGDAGGFGVTPAQAQAQIAELKADKQFMSAYMAGDKGAIAKMQRLMGAAYAAG